MNPCGSKKALLLYVLEVLKEYSDIDHPLSQDFIAEKIYALYMLQCERKSIANNVDCLIELGYDIVKVKNKGVYLNRRDFEPGEIAFLIDAVFSSKVIGSKYAQDIANKLNKELNVHQRKHFKYIYKAREVNRSDNKEVFLNIDIIHQAITQNKQIEFVYSNYQHGNADSGKRRRVSPYFLFNSQGKYYLACCKEASFGISNYRIERMSDVNLSEQERVPVTDIAQYSDGIDIAQYVNENIYAFGGKSVNATLKIYDQHTLTYVEDWFADAKFYKQNDCWSADIKCNEQALVYWALQYGETVEVVSPSSTRDKIKQIISTMQGRYNK